MKYKKYPKYKDSGIEWLGEIPEGWEVRKIKNISKLQKEKSYSLNPVVLSLTRNKIKARDISTGEGQIASTYEGYNIVKKGDFLLNPMDLYSGANCNISYINGVISPAYINLKFQTNINIKLIDYIFKTMYLSMYLFSIGKGVSFNNRWTLNNETLQNIKIYLPKENKQQQIVSFLDKSTAKIDTLIQNQRKLIELLKEKRVALISKVVTKGLNSDVQLKDSGIDWIGEMPKHWEARKMRYIMSFSTGLNITKANLQEKGIPCVNYGEIHSKCGLEVSAEHNTLQCVDKSYLKNNLNSLVQKGDFIFADTSEDLEGAGNFTHLSGENIVFAGYHTIIGRLTDKNIYYRYMAYMLDSSFYRNKIRLSVKGIKVFSITQGILKDSIGILPPLNEQKQIANYLDDKTTKIDKLINKAEKSIELLKEKRTSLISAVVTGKIDVRGMS